MAAEHKRNAEEAMKDTSSLFGLFGNPPNLLLACEEYEKAASKYKASRQFQDSVDCYLKNGELHSQLHSNYLAGKAYEAAALIIDKNLRNPAFASEIYVKAAQECIVSSNSPDKVVELYLKSALVLGDLPSAKERFDDAMTLLETEDRIRFGLEAYTKAFGYALRTGSLEEAIKTSKRMEKAYESIKNTTLFRRQVLSTALIYLKLKDEQNALDVWNQGCMRDAGLNTCEEGEAIQELLQAWATCNQETFNQVLQNSDFSRKLLPYLDREIVGLVNRGIEVSTTSSNKIASSNANLLSLQDEIEEEGYL